MSVCNVKYGMYVCVCVWLIVRVLCLLFCLPLMYMCMSICICIGRHSSACLSFHGQLVAYFWCTCDVLSMRMHSCIHV